MNKIITLCFLLLCTQNAASAEIDVTDKLLNRNLLRQYDEKSYEYLYNQNFQEQVSSWLAHKDNQFYASECIFKMKFIHSKNVLGPLCYLLRQDSRATREKAIPLFIRYVLELKTAVLEISEDPKYSASEQEKAQKIMNIFPPIALLEEKTKACFEPALRLTWKTNENGELSFSPFSQIGTCLNTELPSITLDARSGKISITYLNLQNLFIHHPGHALSETGWTKGNKTSYFGENDISENLMSELEELNKIKKMVGEIARLYPRNGRGSIDSFKKMIQNGEPIFEELNSNGSRKIPPINEHPVWSQSSGIFHELKTSIQSAKESIFIDIFFLGETMGASLAKELVKLAKENPSLKIFILRDMINHFGHREDMEPIYNFLKAYSLLNPSQLIISPSHIKSHKSGLPKIFWNLVENDDLLNTLGLSQHMSLYGKAVSDHSKVLVVDGKSKNPVAFVSSKNWLDSSGGSCYDELIKVEGPAAAIVLDDFYLDMFYGLKAGDLIGMDGSKTDYDSLEVYRKNGWSQNLLKNITKTNSDNLDEVITGILRPFDLLNRDKNGNPTNSKILVNSKGSAQVRSGMNNFNSTRTSALDQNIQNIFFAKNKIRIKDQFLFDRNITLALIKAKKLNSNLDIKILLDPLAIATPKGIPNTLYLDLLSDAGIQIRWKNTIHKEGQTIAQEYHMKTLSVDGKYVISGSANKDQTTMYGSFREEQLDVYDTASTKEHDRIFDEHWNNSSTPFTGFDFEVPQGLTGFNGEPLTQNQFIRLTRSILSLLFDTTIY